MGNDKSKLLTPHSSKLALRNKHCPYCLKSVESKNARTREHVIGRKFVPTGTMTGQWNLVLWACDRCNSEKSNLEDDISAISMLPELGTTLEEDDPRRKDLERKAKGSVSRSTGKPIKDSKVEHKFSGSPMPGMTVTFNVVGLPHVETQRLFKLAHFHIGAFDYLTRYDSKTGMGGRNSGPFFPLMAVRPGDWGNQRMLGFMAETRLWEPALHGVSASGFFKVVIRRRLEDLVWSWAVEYNKCFRIIGFMGHETGVQKYLDKIPLLKMKPITTDGLWRSREEVSLDPAKDNLFEIDDDDTEASA